MSKVSSNLASVEEAVPENLEEDFSAPKHISKPQNSESKQASRQASKFEAKFVSEYTFPRDDGACKRLKRERSMPGKENSHKPPNEMVSCLQILSR